MRHSLIIAVFFLQTVPDRQAVAQVAIAKVVPGSGLLFLIPDVPLAFRL